MGSVRSIANRIGIAGELFSFFARHRRWWMLPMVIVLLLTGTLIILAQIPALAPFIYPLF